MDFGRSPRESASEDDSDGSRLAALHPAHLTHEPVRRPWSWLRFAIGIGMGALVIEVFRRLA